MKTKNRKVTTVILPDKERSEKGEVLWKNMN